MSKFINVALTTTVIIIGISAVVENMKPNYPIQSSNKPISSNSLNNTNAFALRGADNKWPSLNDEQAAVAEDLTKKNYYLVFDGSGSMNESKCSNNDLKINVAKSSVMEFIKKIPDNANVGLTIFDTRGTKEYVSIGSASKEYAMQQINNVSAGGGTPLKSAISHAYTALSRQAVKQLGYGEYHLVVITDGEAGNNEDPRYTVHEMIEQSPVVLHTIGFCIDGAHSLNQEGFTLYKSAVNPNQLSMGLDSVLAEAPDFQLDTFVE